MRIVIMGSQARSMANFWPTLIKTLVKNGHKVVCFVPKTNEEPDARAISLMQSWGASIMQVPLERRGLNPFKDLLSLFALRRMLKYVNPDIFFGYAIKPVIYGTIAAAMAGVPARFAMITGLGYTFEADSLPKRLLTKVASGLYRFALGYAKTVFFQNRDDLAHFKDLNIIPKQPKPDYIQMVRGTGVDITRFSEAAPVLEPPVFLYVGRLIEAKGVREYAEAAKLLKPNHPSAIFRILGPAEFGPGSISAAEVEGWQQQGFIEYLGATDDVRPFIAAASVMVLPSYREGLPTSIMEGMSMGRPAIVTDVPGCREVVDNDDNGFMVPVRDPQSLAQAMQKFILDPELIVKMGKIGRKRTEQEFDANLVAAGLMTSMGLNYTDKS